MEEKEINYIFEINPTPIRPEFRMTKKSLNTAILPKVHQWWEPSLNRDSFETVLEDDEERKDALEYLKEILPPGCTLDIDKETITCTNCVEYLESRIAQLKDLLPNPMAVLSKEDPWWWWKEEIDHYQDALFVFAICGGFYKVITIHELMLLFMSSEYNKDDESTFYVGGIIEINNYIH